MKLRHSSKLLAQALLVAATVPALAAPAQPPARKVTTGQINLNFKDAEVDSVIGAFGHLLNKSFVIDPRVRGKISLETPRPVNRAQAFALLKTVLRQQGFAIVDLGDLYKVVPEADAKLQSGPVEIGAASARDGDEVITQVFQLNHESANNMIPVLRPLVSPNNTITAFPGNNTLIITDYAANLKRLSKVIATLDSPRPAAEVQVVVIKNSIASDIAVAVSKLMDEGNRGGGGGPGAGSDPSQRRSAHQLGAHPQRQCLQADAGPFAGGTAGPARQRRPGQHARGLPEERRGHQAGGGAAGRALG